MRSKIQTGFAGNGKKELRQHGLTKYSIIRLQDQIQLLVTGMAMGLSDGNKIKYRRRGAPTTLPQNGFNDANVQLQQQQFAAQSAVHVTQSQPELNGKRMLQEEDYIFPLDEDQMVDTPTPTSNVIPPFGMSSFKTRKTSPSRLGNLTSALPSAKSLNVAAVPRSRYVRKLKQKDLNRFYTFRVFPPTVSAA